jgi:hypothetical protein
MAVSLVVVACQPLDAPLVTVSDSAGVQITVSAEDSTRYAVVDGVPILSIGAPDATGPSLFANIGGVRQDARGRIWVADGQSAEIRIFERDGTHARTVGRRGEGPGEFMRVRLLGRFAGDSIAVWDDALGRLTVLSPEGNVSRIVTAGTGEAAPPNGFRTYPDGTVLARIREILPAGALQPGTVIPDTAVFARVDYSTMVSEPLGGAPAPKWVWTGRESVPIPFLLNPGFDLAGTALHVTSGTAFRIRVLQAGRLVRSYGLDRGPAPVTDIERAEYASLFEDGPDNTQREDYLSVLAHPEAPLSLPAYRSLVVADDGAVWAERYKYGDFDVYDAEGVFRGKVEVPLTITQVRDSTLVGVWRDEYYVEHVRLYRYRRLLP